MTWRKQRGASTTGVIVGTAVGLAVIGVLAGVSGTNGGGGTTTTTAPAGGTLNGWQIDATNTGFAPGTLTTTRAGGNLNTAGATFTNIHFTSAIQINASNIHISNCEVDAQGGADGIDIGSSTAVTGTVIDHCTVNGAAGAGTNGIGDLTGTNSVITFNNVSNFENNSRIWTGNNTLFENNYLHNDATTGGGHRDGLEIYGVVNGAQIIGNNIVMNPIGGGVTVAPVNMQPNSTYTGTVVVNNNFLSTQNCEDLVLADDSQNAHTIVASVNNNRLVRSTNGGCGFAAGHYMNFYNTHAGSSETCSGNVDGVTLLPIGPPSMIAPTGCWIGNHDARF